MPSPKHQSASTTHHTCMTEKFRLTGQAISSERVIPNTPATLAQCYQADQGSDFRPATFDTLVKGY